MLTRTTSSITFALLAGRNVSGRIWIENLTVFQLKNCLPKGGGGGGGSYLPTMRLVIKSGSIINLSMRRNNSPHIPIHRMASLERSSGLNPNPIANPSRIPRKLAIRSLCFINTLLIEEPLQHIAFAAILSGSTENEEAS